MVTRDSQGALRFDVADEEVLVAMDEVMSSTDIGQLYVEEYLTVESSSADIEKVKAAAVRIAGGPQISADDMARALSLLIENGQIRPKNFKVVTPVEAPEPDTTPRDKRTGKPLTEAQLAWGEMMRFATEASADAIRQRQHKDFRFVEFMQHHLRQEMRATPVADGVVPIGQSQGKKATPELIAFAQKYTKEPSNNLRPRGGYVSLAGEQIGYQDFLRQVDAATAAGLI